MTPQEVRKQDGKKFFERPPSLVLHIYVKKKLRITCGESISFIVDLCNLVSTKSWQGALTPKKDNAILKVYQVCTKTPFISSSYTL